MKAMMCMAERLLGYSVRVLLGYDTP